MILLGQLLNKRDICYNTKKTLRGGSKLTLMVCFRICESTELYTDYCRIVEEEAVMHLLQFTYIYTSRDAHSDVLCNIHS